MEEDGYFENNLTGNDEMGLAITSTILDLESAL